MTVIAGFQARGTHPMVPLDLFRSRTVVIASGTGFAFMAGFYGSVFVHSLCLQQVQGLSPLATGLAVTDCQGMSHPWQTEPSVSRSAPASQRRS